YLAGERPNTIDARGERETLTGFLDWYRTTLELKCAGLTPEQLAQRAVPPSRLSLLGLLRHIAGVEGWWFRIWAGEQYRPRWHDDDPPSRDFEFGAPTQHLVDDTFAYWRTEIEHVREIVAVHELDEQRIAGDGNSVTLRWLLVHMIEEYARHCGHADLLRENVDGGTGY
ncbi:MAG TPA: DinB family protein, partial [Jatrophihabitantaceae bacterium]|nr:DinB family protein [Jatrophihabitantaceae bacterium]